MSDQSQTAIPVAHIAKLANIPIKKEEEAKLEKAFVETLEVVSKLQAIDVSQVEPTFQVTGLENVLREDEVNQYKMFTQEEALANAAESHDGYFVVPQIIAQD
jgi:aspartyl-tRNA(Asn)/glutamyl-tRNA(Gln) amidotransferase subunit C